MSDEKGSRYNTGKRKWSLVHFKSIEPMVEVLEFGAKKYAPENWKKGLVKKEILESIQRHLAALMDGELIDPETGLLHMGHIQCNAMFYNYMIENFPEKIARHGNQTSNTVDARERLPGGDQGKVPGDSKVQSGDNRDGTRGNHGRDNSFSSFPHP